MNCPICRNGKLVRPSELGFDGDGVLICDNEDYKGQPCEYYHVPYIPILKVSRFNVWHKGSLFACVIALIYLVLGVPIIPVALWSLFLVYFLVLGEYEFKRKEREANKT